MFRSARPLASLSLSLSLCANMLWWLSGSQVQAQPLPQPPLHFQVPPLPPLHETFEQQNGSRGIWIDQFGDVDIDLLTGTPYPGSRFYNFTNAIPATLPLTLFIDRLPPEPPVSISFPIAGPNSVPTMGCLDYDPNYGNLWGGSYDNTGRFWYHFYFHLQTPPPNLVSVWVDAFSGNSLFLDTFVHDYAARLWDGLAVMPDSTLYIKSDGGFNLFHVNPNVTNPPLKLADSFLLPFPASGVEVTGNYLFLVSIQEPRLYVYSRTGKYPLGFFQLLDNATTPNPRDVEDLDLRTEGSHIYLAGISVRYIDTITSTVKLLEWDVKPLILDNDNDGVPNVIDNCSTGQHPENLDQKDSNNDGVGDACVSPTLNTDGDAILDYQDNCIYVYNSKQPDADRDGRGDDCDDITQCFGTEQLSALDNRVIDVAIADLDNDGDGDVVTLHDKSYFGPQVGTVAIRWSGSHGSIGNFSEQVAYAVSSRESCRDLVLADINADGYTDIAVVHDNRDDPDGSGPQQAVAPGVTVLWNDRTNHFGELTHVGLRFEENGEELTSGHPVGMFAIHVDGSNDPYPELVVVGNHHFLNGQQQGTITLVRYYFNHEPQLDAGTPIGLSGGVPIRAIAMAPESGQPERDLAILKTGNTVAIHRCTPGVAPFFNTTGYGAQIVGANGNENGRDLAYGLFRTNTHACDLVVIPDEGTNGSRVINLFLNDPVAGTLTLGNGGTAQQLTTNSQGRMWRVIHYPSSPYDGVVVLNDEFPPDTAGGAAGGAQVSRFHATGLVAGTMDVASREDLVDNSRDPRAVMALGDISRSCGRDLVVADYFEPEIAPPGQTLPILTLPRLALARCPFDSTSRSFERPAPSLPTCAVVADVTGSNGPDLIVGTALGELSATGGRVLVYRQTPGIPNRFGYPPFDPDEGEVYRPRIGPIEVDAPILAMAAGRFGSGSLPDVVIGFESGGQDYIQVLRRTSTTAFEVRPETVVTNTGTITALTTGDFDLDNRTDVAVLTTGGAPNLFLSRGQPIDGTLGMVEPIDLSTDYTGAAVAPLFNATTGQLDLCTLLLVPAVRILHNDGGGTFSSSTDLLIDTPVGGSPPTPVAVATGRFVGASAPYIACADFANRLVTIFRDDGGGYYATAIIPVGGPDFRPTSLAAADLDADGDDDLVVGFEAGQTITILSCVHNRFLAMTMPSGRDPRFVTVGDVDGNGLPDIVEVGGDDIFDPNSHVRVIFSNCGGI